MSVKKFFNIFSRDSKYQKIKKQLKEFTIEIEKSPTGSIFEEINHFGHKYKNIKRQIEDNNSIIPKEKLKKLNEEVEKFEKKYRHLGFIDMEASEETTDSKNLTTESSANNRRASLGSRRTNEEQKFDKERSKSLSLKKPKSNIEDRTAASTSSAVSKNFDSRECSNRTTAYPGHATSTNYCGHWSKPSDSKNTNENKVVFESPSKVPKLHSDVRKHNSRNFSEVSDKVEQEGTNLVKRPSNGTAAGRISTSVGSSSKTESPQQNQFKQQSQYHKDVSSTEEPSEQSLHVSGSCNKEEEKQFSELQHDSCVGRTEMKMSEEESSISNLQDDMNFPSNRSFEEIREQPKNRGHNHHLEGETSSLKSLQHSGHNLKNIEQGKPGQIVIDVSNDSDERKSHYQYSNRSCSSKEEERFKELHSSSHREVETGSSEFYRPRDSDVTSGEKENFKNYLERPKPDENEASSPLFKEYYSVTNERQLVKEKPSKSIPKAEQNSKQVYSSMEVLKTDDSSSSKKSIEPYENFRGNFNAFTPDSRYTEKFEKFKHSTASFSGYSNVHRRSTSTQQDILDDRNCSNFSKNEETQNFYQDDCVMVEAAEEAKEESLEILDVHQYFRDDFDLNSIDDLPFAERIEKIENYAKTFENKVNTFNEEKYSLEYFVIDEKLMRLIEKLDKIKCQEKEDIIKKVQVIEYIKNLHSTLDEKAKDD